MKSLPSSPVVPDGGGPGGSIHFEDVFDLSEIQQIQDTFSDVTGVASIMTAPDGQPITKPSNFCDFCLNIARTDPAGYARGFRSDAVEGADTGVPTIINCLSAGLWDSGASIIVEGRHVATWLIGQVMDESVDSEKLVAYGKEIGADENSVRLAIAGVTRMSFARFEKVCNALSLIANQISGMALSNLQQSRQLTEHKRIQHEKRESDIRYARVVRGTTDGIWDWNIQTGEDYHSPRYKELLGYAADEFPDTAEGFESLVHPEDLPRVKAAQSSHIYEGTPYDIELRMRTRQGDFKWFASRGQAEWDTEGRPLRMSGSIIDITDRKRIEQDLKAAANFYMQLLQNAPALIWRAGTDAKCDWFNATWLAFTGRRMDQEAGNGWADGVHPKDFDRCLEIYLESFSARKAFEMEYRLRRHDGEYRWITDSGIPFNDLSGNFGGYIGYCYDVTERKRAEIDLARAKEAAEAANRAKSDFLANMSHEIRTPMNGVIGMAHLLLDTELAADQRSYAETVRSSAESLLTVLNDILDLSKIEAGKLELERIDFDLTSLLDGIGGLLAPRAQAKGISFLCSAAPDVPARICGDPGRLRQVLLNLVGNAVKFTEHGDVAVEVRLLSQSESGLVLRFSIKDTGIGISQAKQVLLFRKFTQADPSTTRRYGGTGLGLAISKELVGLMGGIIGVLSNEGLGTEFWFTARLGLPQEDEPAPAPASLSISTLCRGRGHILLVEDNLTNRLVALGMLKKMGLSADVATNGLDALEYLATKPYDLVLMDVQMPGMDGIEATRQIRSLQSDVRNHGIPIVAMTAFAMQGDSERCLDAGMNDYLRKPVSPRALAEVLDRWLPKAGA